MAKIIPITDQIQHFLREMKERFWGDLYGQTRPAWQEFFELESERHRDRFSGWGVMCAGRGKGWLPEWLLRTEPRWRGDTKEIFYLAPAGIKTAVPVNTIDPFSSGSPVSLFQFHGRAPISSTDMFSYDVTKDGKRFLVNRYVKPDNVGSLTIVLNADGKSPN